jgi:GntR family transcriptional regulator
MDLRLDINSSVPTFQQLVDQVKAAVARGALRPGDPIPSVRQMAAQVLVNPNTVARAYRELDREGVIQAQRGLGYFVTDQAVAACRSDCSEAFADQLASVLQAAREAGLNDETIRAVFARIMENPEEKP